MDRKVAPESMQFRYDFPRILQAIWGAYSVQGPVCVSKLDVMDSYHQGTLWMYQVGSFSCVVPLETNGDLIIICIDLVLTMVCVDSFKFFCTFSETLVDVANSIVNTSPLVPRYGTISKTPKTLMGLPHTLNILIHIYCYMYDVITVVQGGIK